MLRNFWWAVLCVFAACGNPTPEAAPKAPAEPTDPSGLAGEAVKPPFSVTGDLEGLLLVWYDDKGSPQSAQRRSDIPEARREVVRVDSLKVSPDKRLDPAFVYVADVRAPARSGAYAVRKVPRASLDALVQAQAPPVARAEDIVLYRTSWCGVCKTAARFFESKGIPFVEKDIEKDPSARAEMMQKARAQGVQTGGVPMIDLRGKLVGGFNQAQVEQILGG